MRGGTIFLLGWLFIVGVVAADPLPPGIHKGLTSEDGRYRFTVIVPKAGEGNTLLPAVFILPSAFRGLLDPFPWQGLAERRGCYVISLDDGRKRSQGDTVMLDEQLITADLQYVTQVLAAVGNRVQIHPHLRFAVGDQFNAEMAVRFASQPQQNIAGILLTRPWGMDQGDYKTIPQHVPVFVLVGEHDTPSQRSFERVRDDLRMAKVTTRAATVLGGKENDWVPQAGCDLAIDHLLDHALVNHPRLSPEKRSANVDLVLERGKSLMALDDQVCEEQLGFLLSVPGLEVEIKPAYTTLANHWIVVQLRMAEARPDSEIAKAHEALSILSKRPQFKRADKQHQKLVFDELKRLRKDKRIKAEVAAADILADTLAVLEVDFSTAKQRIALKALEDLVDKHPATEAGRAAAKLLEPLRRNLR